MISGCGKVDACLEVCPRQNKDERLVTAYNLLQTHKQGIHLVHKTTRAGATTGIAAESINLNEQFLILVPTNKIATKTIVHDAVKYSDVYNAKVIHVPSNHNCIKNAEMCEEYPALQSLPFLPLPEACGQCESYEECPVTEIIRKPKSHGFALTYHKIVALQLSSMMGSVNQEPSISEQILGIISNVKNVILDEIHEVQYGKKTTRVVYDSRMAVNYRESVDKYVNIPVEYDDLWAMIINFQKMRVSQTVEFAIHEIKMATEADNYWDKHISKTIKNDFTDFRKTDEYDITKVIIGIYQDIIEITKNKDEYNIHIKDILGLIDMLNITINENLVIHAERRGSETVVLMSSIDSLHTSLLKSFTMSIQNKSKRIILTSATICSYDYSSMFIHRLKPDKCTFGIGGDPLKTNSKLTIISDTKQLYAHGKSSYFTKKDGILHHIIEILEGVGDKNCIIITLNKKSSVEVEKDLKAMGHPHKVTYYKAPSMMGVSSDARVMIAIGAAQKPRNSFDSITEDRNDSDILLEEAMHCDTWQAWSRVKDPKGESESIVFAIGVNETTCKNVVSWGFDRSVEIEHSSNEHTADRKKINVKSKKQCISLPNIVNAKDFSNARLIAGRILKVNFFCSDIAPSPLLYYIIGDLRHNLSKLYKVVTKQSLILNYIFNRYDVYAQQHMKNGSWFKTPDAVDGELIESHFTGDKTVGAYNLRNGDTVKWLCFDIDAHPKDTDTPEQVIQKEQNAVNGCKLLCSELRNVDFPYLLEASGSPYSYHVWVFLKDVKADKARSFGNEIIKALGIDCEVFPKQVKLQPGRYGNLVKCPLGTHQKHGGLSYVHVDGEWVRDFEKIKIGIVDISDYSIPKKPSRKSRSTKVNGFISGAPMITGVRPCIQSALTKSLTGTQGHAMRIAVVREFFNFGMESANDLAMLFKTQSDFNFDKSIFQVQSIIKDKYRIWSKMTLNDKCSQFVNCSECENVVCKEW